MKYWYKIWIDECVYCGLITKLQERQYTPKPKDRDDRVFVQLMMCSDHKY